MGNIFIFPKSERQIKGKTTPSKFIIDNLPIQTGTLIFNDSVQYPTWLNLDLTKLSVTGETSAINAGKHSIFVTPIANWTWQDGSQSTKEIFWEILRKKIAALPVQAAPLTFNGNSQSPTWLNFNPDELTISGDFQNKIDGDSYPAIFTPTNNFAFPDGSTEDKIIYWNIDPMKIPKPSANKTTYQFTGSQIAIDISNFQSDFMTRTGTIAATAKGNYQVAFNLKNIKNTIWLDDSTEEVKIDWAIGSGVVQIPTITGELTFNGNSQAAPLSYTDDDLFEVTEDDTASNAGTHYVTCVLKDKVNMTWADGKTADKRLAYKINKAVVATPYINGETEFTYSGSAIEPDIIFDEVNCSLTYPTDQINSGSKTTKVNLDDPNNFKFDSTNNAYVNLGWKINKCELDPPAFDYVNSGDDIEMTWTGSQPDWAFTADPNLITRSDPDDLINVGNKNFLFTIKADKQANYKFKGYSGTAAFNYTLTGCKIVKAEIELPESPTHKYFNWSDGTYDDFMQYSIYDWLVDVDLDFTYIKGGAEPYKKYLYEWGDTLNFECDREVNVIVEPDDNHYFYGGDSESRHTFIFQIPPKEDQYPENNLHVALSLDNKLHWINPLTYDEPINLSPGQTIYISVTANEATEIKSLTFGTAYGTTSDDGEQLTESDRPTDLRIAKKIVIKDISLTSAKECNLTVRAPAYSDSKARTGKSFTLFNFTIGENALPTQNIGNIYSCFDNDFPRLFANNYNVEKILPANSTTKVYVAVPSGCTAQITATNYHLANYFELSSATANDIPTAQPSSTTVLAFNVTNKNATGQSGAGILSLVISRAGYQDKKVHFATNVNCESS